MNQNSVRYSPDIFDNLESEVHTNKNNVSHLKDARTVKQCPVSDKTSRKRKRNPECWKRKKAAIAREKGIRYISQCGKVIPAKHVSENAICSCRLKCSSKFSTADKNNILSSFYKLDVNGKNALLFKSINITNVKRRRTNAVKNKSASYKYYITYNCKTITVCKTALCSLYQIGRKKIDVIKKSISEGLSAPIPDKRGQHDSRPHKIRDNVKNYVIDHIKKFPSESSHYSRNSNPYKRYLSPLLSVSKMHSLYINECKNLELPAEYHVKECTYRNIFVTEFNLSFAHPKSDTCSTCDSNAMSEEHVENYNAAYNAMNSDREKVKNSKDICYLTIDLQQTMPLPKLSTSKAFYLRQMWFYNFGIHILYENISRATFCTWTEDIASRGSVEIYSSFLTALELDNDIKSKNHLIIWSDSAGGQNKNFLMVYLYQYLILKGIFSIIDHKFPEVGHTYLDSDRDFGRIEKNLRKHQNIYVPEEYRNVISSTCKKNIIIDMSKHFRNFDKLTTDLKIYSTKVKDCLGEKVRFRDGIKWIRVEKFGSYLYKECYDEYTPFKQVNLVDSEKVDTVSLANNIFIPRLDANVGSISGEKIENLKQQLKFIPDEHKWFYEMIFKLQKDKDNENIKRKNTGKSTTGKYKKKNDKNITTGTVDKTKEQNNTIQNNRKVTARRGCKKIKQESNI